MSTQEQPIEVKLENLVFTFEDIAKIDAILGTLAYKIVKPIYNIIENRMKEQAEAKLAEMQTETHKSPAQEPIERMPLRDK